jgi:hypothetical protein
MSRGETFKPYVILEKDGNGTQEIYDKKEAQDLINKGYKVRIDKAGWKLKAKVKKAGKPKKKKKK